MIVSNHRRDETIDSSASPLDQLVQKRLEIVRMGLTEVHRRLDDGLEFDAEVILPRLTRTCTCCNDGCAARSARWFASERRPAKR